MGIVFVYRTHYEGPLSKRIRRLRAPSIVAWFARKIAEAQKSAHPGDVADAELGGGVYGLSSLFEAAKKEKLTPPKTTAALRALLDEHLYVEGSMRLDAHSLRVKTDDDEVDLAYFFLDEKALKQRKRLAYLLLDKPRLPRTHANRRFVPPTKVKSLKPAVPKGKGQTYACLLTFTDSDSMPGSVHAFEGVRLPELAAYLRRVTPPAKPASWSKDIMETWPFELRLLRAMVVEGDRDLRAALIKCGAYPIMSLSGEIPATHLGIHEHAVAEKEFADAAKNLKNQANPKKTILDASAHAALLCIHASGAFGYQQWILFDDCWASANSDLASSILRYASGWDPFRDGGDDDDDDDD